MTILSSRPDTFEPSDDEMLEAINPAINILGWLAIKTMFQDGTKNSSREGQTIIEEIVSCFTFVDFAVRPVPGTPGALLYEVAVRPFALPKYATFRVTFRVKL
jgi:hypothetical protein